MGEPFLQEAFLRQVEASNIDKGEVECMRKKLTVTAVICSLTMAVPAVFPSNFAAASPSTSPVTSTAVSNPTAKAELAQDLAVFGKDLNGLPLTANSYNGGVVPIDSNAFAVMADKKSTSLMAASRYGKGRVVATGAESFFNFKEADAPQSAARVARNTLMWLTEDLSISYEKALAGEGRISILSKSKDFSARADLPIDITRVDSWSDKDTAGKPLLDPAKYPVAHIDYAYVTEDEADLLFDYVKKGGRLAVALKGWVLEQYPDRAVGLDSASLSSDYPLQQLLNKLGLSLMNNMATQWNGTAPVLTPEESANYSLDHLLSTAQAIEAGTLSIEKAAVGFADSTSEEKQSILTSSLVASLGPMTPNSPLYQQVLKDSNKLSDITLPFDDFAKPYSAALLPLLLERILQDPNGTKSPFADAFPGSVPESAQPVVNQKIDVNFDFSTFSSLRQLYTPKGWVSTGLYADPGKTITVNVPEGVTDLDVQIGTHTDNLSSLGMKEWLRAPVVVKRETLKPGINKITSPYGGLLYLIPTKSTPSKTATVTIDGGYQAPYFVLGKTSLNEWKNTIRNYPAPWAELQSDRMIMTVPSSFIKSLDNPDEVLEKWDEMFEQFDQIVGLKPDAKEPHKSVNLPFRFVGDKQISAGFMHAGYPIMFFSEFSAKDAVTVEGITRLAGWGWWHETGHEYQQTPWTWGAITEATVNLFSLHAQDHFKNSSRLLLKRSDGTTVYDKAFAYLNKPDAGKDFNSDQIDVWSRLVMFRQLQMAYGWDFYSELFADVRELPESELPKNEQGEMDLFVTKAVEISGNNLLEFFNKWGLKYSDTAKRKVEAMNLPKPEQELWKLKETSLITGPETTKAAVQDTVTIPFELSREASNLSVQINQTKIDGVINGHTITLNPSKLGLAAGEHRVYLTATDTSGVTETATFTLNLK